VESATFSLLWQQEKRVMKRDRKTAKRNRHELQVWTYDKARSAIPYILSIVRSLREHAIEIQTRQKEVQRLAELSGRPDRTRMIAQQEAEREWRRAEHRFEEAAGDLEQLDIFCLDPIRGQAVVPFIHDEQLAWYIFDLFDNTHFRFWRYQSDPEDTRRPITSMQQGASMSM
jgi:hypothetical protein